MLTQHIATLLGRNMLRVFGHPVAPCYDMMGVVGSNLTIFKLEPTPNISQQGGQTRTTCCAQQCCDRLAGALCLIIPNYPYLTLTTVKPPLTTTFLQWLLFWYWWTVHTFTSI